MRHRLPPLAAVLVLAAAPAAAEDFYVYGGLGVAGYAQAQSDLDDEVAFRGPTASGVSDQTAGAVKFGVGYRFDERWGVEGGLLGVGEFKRTVVSAAGTEVRKMDAGAAFVAARYFIPVSEGKAFYLSGGLASWRLTRTYTGPGAVLAKNEDTGAGLKLGLGFSAVFTGTTSIFIDYDIVPMKMREHGASERAGFGLLSFGVKGLF